MRTCPCCLRPSEERFMKHYRNDKLCTSCHTYVKSVVEEARVHEYTTPSRYAKQGKLSEHRAKMLQGHVTFHTVELRLEKTIPPNTVDLLYDTEQEVRSARATYKARFRRKYGDGYVIVHTHKDKEGYWLKFMRGEKWYHPKLYEG